MQPNESPAGMVQLRMIVASLIAGVVMFTGIAMVVPAPANAGGSSDLLRLVCAGLLVVNVPVSLLVRHALIGAGRPSGDNPYAADAAASTEVDLEELFRRFTTATIIAAALLEGVALFGAIVVLLYRQMPDLALVALPVLVMAFGIFPTNGRWRRTVESARGGR